MKQASKILILLLVIVGALQSCQQGSVLRIPKKIINGSVSLPTQAVVDSFVNANSEVDSLIINGSVVIGGNANNDVSDISGLGNLVEITGDLGVISTSLLHSLQGLEQIRSLRNVYFEVNGGLSNLHGLNNLKKITGFLFIENDYGLKNLDGLENLESITGAFKLSEGFFGGSSSYNRELLKVNLPKLKFIGDDCDFSNIKPVRNFDLPALDTIKGTFRIGGTENMSNLTGLNTLKYIGRDLIIANNNITGLNGLNSLKEIGGHLTIQHNNISNLAGFSSLLKINGPLQITFNGSLLSLSGIETLQDATLLSIEYNAQLVSFCAIKPLIIKMINAYPATPPPQLFIFTSNGIAGLYNYNDVLNNCP